MVTPRLIDKRFLVMDGQEYDLNIQTSVRNDIDYEAAFLRDGIEQILNLHGEDFIKTRLRKLLET